MGENNLGASGVIVQGSPTYVNALYNQYAGMLLGYIFEVVKNMTVAEQYLIAVFKDVPHQLDELTKADGNTFCHLQLMARKKLTGFFDQLNNCEDEPKKQLSVANANNKYVGIMTSEQQHVFCGIYWHGKSVSKLATELEKTEDAVRKVLKECFTTIRNSSK